MKITYSINILVLFLLYFQESKASEISKKEIIEKFARSSSGIVANNVTFQDEYRQESNISTITISSISVKDPNSRNISIIFSFNRDNLDNVYIGNGITEYGNRLNDKFFYSLKNSQVTNCIKNNLHKMNPLKECHLNYSKSAFYWTECQFSTPLRRWLKSKTKNLFYNFKPFCAYTNDGKLLWKINLKNEKNEKILTLQLNKDFFHGRYLTTGMSINWDKEYDQNSKQCINRVFNANSKILHIEDCIKIRPATRVRNKIKDIKIHMSTDFIF